MNKLKILAGLCLMLVAGLATADQLTGRGSTYWSGTLAATTTSACVDASSAGSADCALFPAGAPQNWKKYNAAVLTASADVACCWCLDKDCGLDPGNLEVDALNKGVCFNLTSTTVWHDRPSYEGILATGDTATGVCDGYLGASDWDDGAAGDTLMAVPCVNDTDCTDVGLTTCTAAASVTATQKSHVGAHLICETASGSATVYAVKTRVLNH